MSNELYKLKRRKLLNKLKDNPCTDCGIKFPPMCMEFDHLNPATKKFAIATASQGKSIKNLMEEIAKCELVCANCHAIRTWQRRYSVVIK